MNLESPRSRYQQVADDLRDAIKRGDHPPGSTLPSQPELARRYGLNQTSINRAIAVLRAEGLVRVEHGRGAYVQEIPTVKRVRRIDKEHRPHTGSSAYAEEMRKSGLTPRTELVRVDTVIPPAEIAELFGLGETERTLIRHRHMFAEDVPLQIATSYIPMSYAGSTDLALPDTGPTGIYSRLAERGHEPVRFTEEIEVRAPDPAEARFLRISEGQPVFEVLRVAIDAQDRPVEACVNILAALQWRLSYSWRQEP
ncbi:GntR family transcriptional regulator [Actinomadura macrotermitis]|uniref:HTH-type transcriptional repressor YvoA n=1 Tax=Actinomadura macrotermitis TaxID=2585200 RepID=A0A7K0BX06_9ACTN|nr:GntR family transcriptional regulator [Actinomadura macrotermitis]MQY05715.1 HTH-type transcriptional repressor YvoA [Actinomadura macrotermitis]